MFKKIAGCLILIFVCFFIANCNRQKQDKLIHRTDYKPPAFLIDSINLTIDLKDKNTIVDSIMHVSANPNAVKKARNLVLDGEQQQLKSVKLNGKILSLKQYKLNSNHLTILHVPSKFTLEVISTNNPIQNTELTGIYKSHNVFISSCEAEGFRKITYFLDRPDVLSLYTVKLIANKQHYPVLLSNGNLIKKGNLPDGRHYAIWKDPFVKPCYLFALVAGNLGKLSDSFTTMSGKKVNINIYAFKDKLDYCHFALKAIKKAMRWDEIHYGREYDLNIFNIVAIPDFNAGAMENKSLNIFNDKYVLIDSRTATDEDYNNAATTIAHEYFHNWTGNRVTLRDWFQLTLKEGLTVFREQSFARCILIPTVKRIDEVNLLRLYQFPEDSGPLAHAIRPNAYINPDNFYTTTVYKKGTEVIRMIHIILGANLFRKGMDLYFKKYDGQAITCDDFIKTMQDANHINLSQFKLWYSQLGTPELFFESKYDSKNKRFYLTVKQLIPKTPKQPHPKNMMIPVHIGFLDQNGHEMPIHLIQKSIRPNLLLITKKRQTFAFKNVEQKPVVSLLRQFTAPIKIHYNYSDRDLALLMKYDKDGFARWNASRIYLNKIIKSLISKQQKKSKLIVPENYLSALKMILLDKNIEKGLAAKILMLPKELQIASSMDKVDPDNIHKIRESIIKTIAQKLKGTLLLTYNNNTTNKPYSYDIQNVERRSLENRVLYYLVALNTLDMRKLALRQFHQADNMTEKMGALWALNNISCPERKLALSQFYDEWKNNPIVFNKWLQLQASSSLPNTLNIIQKTLNDPKFNIKNPNNVYALLQTFATQNIFVFNKKDGAGYKLAANQIIRLNSINKIFAADLTRAFASWRKLDEHRQALVKEQLNRILKIPNLSENVYEIASKILGSSEKLN